VYTCKNANSDHNAVGVKDGGCQAGGQREKIRVRAYYGHTEDSRSNHRHYWRHERQRPRRRAGQLQKFVREIEIHGGEALAVQTDVAEHAQVERLMAHAEQRFGHIDILVNNAGVGLTARFADQSIEDFRRAMAVNFWGTVYAYKAVVPRMRAQPTGGVIINVS
jgi:NAD(P)-dependent dehydrogenase (short-subunit alcohol dehydrogenase family)